MVNRTLQEIGAQNIPTYVVFNKVDNYHYEPLDEFDLVQPTRANVPLDELKRSWIAKNNLPCIFISAKNHINIDEFRDLIYNKARAIHAERYPYNNFLFENFEDQSIDKE